MRGVLDPQKYFIFQVPHFELSIIHFNLSIMQFKPSIIHFKLSIIWLWEISYGRQFKVAKCYEIPLWRLILPIMWVFHITFFIYIEYTVNCFIFVSTYFRQIAKKNISSILTFVIWRLAGCKFVDRDLSIQCLAHLMELVVFLALNTHNWTNKTFTMLVYIITLRQSSIVTLIVL